jgi:hypothetical protein
MHAKLNGSSIKAGRDENFLSSCFSHLYALGIIVLLQHV